MTKDEALKLALEALEDPWKAGPDGVADAIIAIKEVLTQPEQEPVAWRAWVSKFPQGTGSDWVYVTKPIMKDRIHNQPLYTTPPQRTWVGLTNDELTDLFYNENLGQESAVSQAIALLKERNT